MSYSNQANDEKLTYLMQVLAERAAVGKETVKNAIKVFYTISLMRFNSKVPVIVREPASTNIQLLVSKYASSEFKPDYILVELFTGRSHNIKKPFATFKFDYSRRWNQ